MDEVNYVIDFDLCSEWKYKNVQQKKFSYIVHVLSVFTKRSIHILQNNLLC